MGKKPGISGVVALMLPIAEIWAFVKLGSGVGWIPVLGLLAGLSVLGMFLLRTRLTSFANKGIQVDGIQKAIAEPEVAAAGAAEHGLRLLGVVLLIVPGLITGLFGALLLLPPVRALVKPRVSARFSRLVSGAGPLGIFSSFSRFDGSDVIDVDEAPRPSPAQPELH